MARSRKLKEQLDRPPHRPLTKEEIERIATAGGINFADRAEQAREFGGAIEYLRSEYKRNTDWKKLSLTDRQLEDRLYEVRKLARQLQNILSIPAFHYQTSVLLAGDHVSLPRPAREREAAGAVALWADLCLEKLKARSTNSPDDWAVRSAQKPGLGTLMGGLVYVWQIAKATIKPKIGIDSHLILFLREGALAIAQHSIDSAAAIKWARSVAPLKRLDLGYLLFRPINDPVFLQYLAEHGPDGFNALI
jgi:hypothetical protein